MEFLRPKDVIKKMKISKTMLYEYIRKGLFPKPKKIGRNASIWLDTEVEKIMLAFFKGADEKKLREIAKEIECSRN